MIVGPWAVYRMVLLDGLRFSGDSKEDLDEVGTANAVLDVTDIMTFSFRRQTLYLCTEHNV
jgi:hypothetical protein